jgi:phage replication O-like protein O
MVAMASPQKENGHLDVANEIAEALAFAPLSGSQFRLLWVLLRKTYGWQKKQDVISAGQFAEATGLHRKVVERELRELAERRYILAWGDGHHPKTYALQKDYAIWDDGEVGTRMLPLADQSGNQNAPKWEPNGSKVGTKMLPTITTIQKPGITESHDSAASGTLRDRFAYEWRTEKNKGAVAGKYFQMLLGQKPDIGRLGGMWGKHRLNSGGRLFDLMLEASKQQITDDPHDYLERLVQRELAKKDGPHEANGRRDQGRDHRSGYQASRLAVGAPGSHGAGGTDSWATGPPLRTGGRD